MRLRRIATLGVRYFFCAVKNAGEGEDWVIDSVYDWPVRRFCNAGSCLIGVIAIDDTERFTADLNGAVANCYDYLPFGQERSGGTAFVIRRPSPAIPLAQQLRQRHQETEFGEF